MTGSISSVYTRGNRSNSGEQFYVVFWEVIGITSPDNKTVDSSIISLIFTMISSP